MIKRHCLAEISPREEQDPNIMHVDLSQEKLASNKKCIEERVNAQGSLVLSLSPNPPLRPKSGQKSLLNSKSKQGGSN